MKQFFFCGLLLAVIIGTLSCAEKPFRKETAQKREELKGCFDKGDDLGEVYHVMSPRPADTGVFTEGNLQAGAARDTFMVTSCADFPGAKCQRACKYGVMFPHSYKGAGIKLDDLWEEKDFKLPN